MDVNVYFYFVNVIHIRDIQNTENPKNQVTSISRGKYTLPLFMIKGNF